MNFTQEKIEEAYEKSDPVIINILDDSWVERDVVFIGKDSSIRIDKIERLVKIVGFVILNLIPLSKLIEVMEMELECSNEKALEIAEKVDEFIFKKIREKIKKEKTNSLKFALEETEKKVGENSFSEMFQKNKTTKIEEDIIDPYREEF